MLIWIDPCVQAGQKNPFNKIRSIAPMKFVKEKYNNISSKISTAKNKIGDYDFEAAENELKQAEEELNRELGAQNRKTLEQKNVLQDELRETWKILGLMRKKKEIDDIFTQNKDEWRWEKYRDQFSQDFDGEDGQKLRNFLVDKWRDMSKASDLDELGGYKCFWLDLVDSNSHNFGLQRMRNIIANLPRSRKENARYLAGVATLNMKEFREAEDFFTYDFDNSQIKVLAQKGKAEANAKILLSLVPDQFFINGKLVEDIERVDQSISPVPISLFPIKRGEKSWIELELREQNAPLPNLKLAWLYSMFGWYPEAGAYLKKEISSRIEAPETPNQPELIALSQFYGRIMEEAYIPNCTNSEINFPNFVSNNLSAFKVLADIEGTFRETLKKSGALNSPSVIYMNNWLEAYKIYQQTNQSTNNINAKLAGYKSALKKCPESFLFQERCFNLFRSDWTRSNQLSLPFYGHNGFYQLTFHGSEVNVYASVVQIISLIQFLEKVTYTQSREIRSATDVTPSLMKKDFLQRSAYRDVPIDKEVFSLTMHHVYQICKERHLNLSPKGSSTSKPPWTKISSYIDKGNQYKERNQLIAAVSAYLKSIALIPTPEAYDRLKKVLENINMKLNEEHADIYQTIKQNLQENLKGCRQQIEKFP